MNSNSLLLGAVSTLMLVNTFALPAESDIYANSGSDTVQIIGTSNETTTITTSGAPSVANYPGMNVDDFVAPVDTPARSASDPWDWPCYAPRNPGEHMHAVLPCSPRPTRTAAPDGPAPESGASRPVTVTRSQVSRLLVGGSGITRQPPSASTRLGMPVIVYTSPAPQTLTTTVLGTPVTITATPRTYTWSWADGTTTRTTDPGHPYPHHTVYHYYQHPAQGLRITLTTTWSATYTTPEGTTRPVAGTITTTSTTTPFNVKAYTAVLTDEAEHAQGH